LKAPTTVYDPTAKIHKLCSYHCNIEGGIVHYDFLLCVWLF